MKLRFLALILQILRENSRKLVSLSVSLSKIAFWSFYLSSPFKMVVAPPFISQGFVLQQVRTTHFLCSEKRFSLQRVGSGCSASPLIMRILTTTNLFFATVSTPCLDSLCASIFLAFQLRFVHFHGLCILQEKYNKQT